MSNRDLTVLAIDDNRDNLTVLRAVLADHLPDARFLSAINGINGIEIAISEEPDVILLDVVMPGMDGYEVCLRLKSDERLQTIPILFITALRSDRASRIKALESGAEGFLSKPFDEVELVAQIRAMAKIRAANRLQRLTLESQLQQSQKMESIGRLAGGVAHDFNNMLSVIIGYSELALTQIGPDKPLFAELHEICKAAGRAADLTRQLLTFARKQTINPKVLDLNETVEEMLKMLKRLIGEDLDLVWLPGVELWKVKVDPSQIDQILANLCVNARDAISGVGTVTIQTRNITTDESCCAIDHDCIPGQFVLLTVGDNGCGMDKDALGKIFEPFFTTKEVGKGTGLGLATVYGIIRQNNGFIKVCSRPGRGTTFKIHLPRYMENGESHKHEHSTDQATGGDETILLVEDDLSILKLTTIMLKRAGYKVLPASTPSEAIDIAQEHSGRFDLLMTDVVMPKMNGRHLAEKLISLYPHLRHLFMSGYTTDIIAHEGVIDQGLNFIQKPFSFNGLIAKVREALDGK